MPSFIKIGLVVLPLWVVENRPFPLLWPLAYTTAYTTVHAVIYVCYSYMVIKQINNSFFCVSRSCRFIATITSSQCPFVRQHVERQLIQMYFGLIFISANISE